MARTVSLNEDAILTCLVDHLSVGTIFRLRRALGRAPAWDERQLAKLVAEERMGMRPASLCTMRTVARVMHRTIRCRECGASTRCKPSVCAECTADQTSFVGMCTRADVYNQYRGRRGLKRIVGSLPLAKRVVFGYRIKYYYWRRDVTRILGHTTSSV